MQTFLPYPSFRETAQVLDYKRLGKQRVEAWQVLKALRGETKGWRNHPAVLMWKGYESALKEYGREMCIEWSARGYTDNMLERFNYDGRVILPSWLGERRLHLSHQSNLVRKNPEYYSDKFPNVSPDMPYYWVTKENNNG